MKSHSIRFFTLSLAMLVTFNTNSFDPKAMVSGIYNHFSNNKWKYATLWLFYASVKNVII